MKIHISRPGGVDELVDSDVVDIFSGKNIVRVRTTGVLVLERTEIDTIERGSVDFVLDEVVKKVKLNRS